MATAAENLITRRDAIAAQLAAGGMTAPDGTFVSFNQPSYTADGETVDMPAYVKGLYEELKLLNETLAALSGPWECVIEGIP